MAVSKPVPDGHNRKIYYEEIEIFCIIRQPKATSIEIIEHLLGGPNMEYTCIEVENSVECFKHCKKIFESEIREASKIWYHETKVDLDEDIHVAVIKNKKQQGIRDHLILKVLVRLTIDLTPNVGFCRMIDTPSKT